jgi:hypothetical protein
LAAGRRRPGMELNVIMLRDFLVEEDRAAGVENKKPI